MRQKVAAALEQAESLEAKIDSKQADHDRALAALNEDKCSLQRKLAEAQIVAHNLGLDLQAAQEKAARQESYPVPALCPACLPRQGSDHRGV